MFKYSAVAKYMRFVHYCMCVYRYHRDLCKKKKPLTKWISRRKSSVTHYFNEFYFLHVPVVPVSGRVRLLANRVKLVGLYKHVNLPLAQLDDDGTSCIKQ